MTFSLIRRYTHWLHTRWPAGKTEALPVVNDDGSTRVPGLWVAGDLAGVPLLKMSIEGGARVVRRIAEQSGHGAAATGSGQPPEPEIAILGAGVAGMSAALECRRRGIPFVLIESAEAFSTVVNFPKGKPIYTYPHGFHPDGALSIREDVHPREALLEDLRRQTQDLPVTRGRATHVERKGGRLRVILADGAPVEARHVIVAIGRSGEYRKLQVPGETLDKVSNRLHDPNDFAGKACLVVGGGDSALETAIALAESGAVVTLSYRRGEFGRPKPANLERLDRLQRLTRGTGAPEEAGSVEVIFNSTVRSIDDQAVALALASGATRTIPNDNVFTMIGRSAPLDFFRRSGVSIHGEKNTRWWVTLGLFLAFCVWMYLWKKPGVHIAGPGLDRWLDIGTWWQQRGWFPYNVSGLLGAMGEAWNRPSNLLGVLHKALDQPGFYYSVVYTACVIGFGIARVRRRKTPYVKYQTIVLAAVQIIPLFLLPYILLPWMGYNGWFADGSPLAGVADQLFERYDALGYERAYWRAFGLILAWPLFLWNVFTDKPMWTWLAISLVQTFVLIPGAIYFFGKGAYCGWVCSCGALAETLGDTQRSKMPHGPFWNRLNMLGQAFLLFAVVLLGLRIVGWVWPGGAVAGWFNYLLRELPVLNYSFFVDLLWSGILGVGLYFWFSGRVWCRFACPLAALMHIYARFSRFAIVPEKKKCISCNVCTSVCHQGIDVMAFANKGQPMQDPECVRCSACVQMCPTNVLTFGMVDKHGRTIRLDKTPATLLAMEEVTINGRKKSRSLASPS